MPVKLSEIKGLMINKAEVEPVCMCDCIPCKTDTCDRCELPVTHGGINALCNEECDSDQVNAFNDALSLQSEVCIGLSREKLANEIFECRTDDMNAEICYRIADAIIASESTLIESKGRNGEKND